MTTNDVRAWSAQHAEPIVLALVTHELVAGAAFSLAGLPGVGSFLWALGTGLALAYLLVNLLRIRASRQPQRFVVTTVLLAATVGGAVGGVYGVGNLMGLLGVLAVMFLPRPRGTSFGHNAAERSSDERSHDRT
jgi:hypothetical protein